MIRRDTIELKKNEPKLQLTEMLEETKIQPTLMSEVSTPVARKQKSPEKQVYVKKPRGHEDEILFTESTDDSIESTDELEERHQKLHQVFVVSRKWLLRSNMGLFATMLERDEKIAFFYTPITPDDIQITFGMRKLAWVAHEIRMKALIKNITKVTTEDDWPP